MPEEITSTVKESSDGMVKISVEKYDDLLRRAAEKPPIVRQEVIRNVEEIIKTPEMVAEEHKIWGISLMGLGASLLLVGAIRFKIGLNQAAKLVKN